MEQLGTLQALTSLDLGNNGWLEDVKPLAQCSGLRCLVLKRCSQLTDVTPLTACVALESLDLRCCERLNYEGCLDGMQLRELQVGDGDTDSELVSELGSGDSDGGD